jgi:DNA-binding response OmpR family regulator
VAARLRHNSDATAQPSLTRHNPRKVGRAILSRRFPELLLMAKILLVDDDEDLSETLCECLEMDGHEVSSAVTGTQALQQMRAEAHDIVILDWQLPELEGLEVCRQYRQSGGTDKILMLTGKRDAQSQQEGHAAGATEFLVKPFTADQLIERINSLLARV